MYTSFCFVTLVRIIQSLAGFLPGRSAQLALLSVTHDWLKQLENGNEVCYVVFDLKKAFNSIPHSLLLQKLRNRSWSLHYPIDLQLPHLQISAGGCWWRVILYAVSNIWCPTRLSSCASSVSCVYKWGSFSGFIGEFYVTLCRWYCLVVVHQVIYRLLETTAWYHCSSWLDLQAMSSF